MSEFTPSAEELVLAAVNIPEAEARRGIAKVKSDARNEVIDYMSRHYEGYLPLGWHRHVAEETGGEA